MSIPKRPIKATIYANDGSKIQNTGMFLKHHRPNTQAYYEGVIKTWRGNGQNAIRNILFYDTETDQQIGQYTPDGGFVMNYQPANK